MSQSSALAPPRVVIHTVNRRLLLVSAVAISCILPTAYFWYQNRLKLTADAFLTRASQLEHAEQWDEAASYYQRYLMVNPANTEALLQLTEAYSKGSGGQRPARLNSMLYQALGRAPERLDLRMKLAENLLTQQDFINAEIEASKLLESESEYKYSAQKVISLARLARSPVDDSVSIQQTAQSLIEVADHLPQDIALAEVLARCLRQHSSEIVLDGVRPAELADRKMDELVLNNAQEALAYLARYRYRKEHKLEGADEDLNKALELAPQNPEVLLLSALKDVSPKSSTAELTEAEAKFRKVIQISPQDFRAYWGLSNLLEQSGRIEQAEVLLQEGSNATGGQIDLELALVKLMLREGKIEESERRLQLLVTESATYLPRLPSDKKSTYENRLQLVQADLDLAKGEPLQAISKLRGVFLAEDALPANRRSLEWAIATRLLAVSHTKLGELDIAADYWKRLAQVRLGDTDVTENVVDAFLKEGRAKEALATIDKLEQTTGLSDALLIQRVAAHSILQFGRLPAERNWVEFQRALREAKTRLPGRKELLFYEVDYLASEPETAPSASSLLRAAEEEYTEDRSFWFQAALRYHYLKLPNDFERALAKHQIVASPIEHASLEAIALANDGKYEEADATLAKAEAGLDAEQLRLAQQRRVRLLSLAGKTAKAFELVKHLVESHPNNPQSLVLGAEVALTANKLEVAKDWEDRLRIETDNGPQARLLSIRRMLQTYDPVVGSQSFKLERLISEMRSGRPRWYPIVSLAARFAELNGEKQQAILDYQQAVDLGDRRPFTLQQLILLLYDASRLDEASEYLALLANDSNSEQFVNNMRVEVAVKQDRIEEALELAQLGVERFPKDASRHLYLANLLLREGRMEEAIQVMRNATNVFAGDERIWTSLITVLVQAGHKEEARQTIDTLRQHNSVIPQKLLHEVLANGYEAVGDKNSALQMYEVILGEQPTNNQIRLRYARLLSQLRPNAARQEYERILRTDLGNAAARRELAILLAATAEEADWDRALKLLETDRGKSSASESDLLRAMLLSRRGRTQSERSANREAAAQMLGHLIERSSDQAAIRERLLLANILTQEALATQDESLLISAREQYRLALAIGPTSFDSLSKYIEFLISSRIDTTGESNDPTGSEISRSVNSLRREFLEEAEDRLTVLRKLIADEDLGAELFEVYLSSRLLQEQGQAEAAQGLVGQFVKKQTQRESSQYNRQLLLSIGRLYAELGYHSEAENWYRKLFALDKNAYRLVVQELIDQKEGKEAVDFCLEISGGELPPEMASLLANIMTITEEVNTQNDPAAMAAIEDALQLHAENVTLLLAEATLRASKNDYEGAIRQFRRILQLDPENEVALNNLATLLAERPNQRSEALELVERAVELVGRQPALLDTKGTILLKLGDAAAAISCLEEATAGGASDARYFLHLAIAYHRAERREDAEKMLAEAHKLHLEQFVLTEDDLNDLSILEDALSRSTAQPTNQL